MNQFVAHVEFLPFLAPASQILCWILPAKLEKENCNRTHCKWLAKSPTASERGLFYLCVPFFGRNVDCHVNLSTLIFISSINRCQVTCELATTFLFRVVWCFCFVNGTLLTHVLYCYPRVSHARGASGWFTKYAVRVFCEGGKLLPRKICPWKTAVSLGGGGRGCMYSTYLDYRHLNKYRVV